MREWLSKEFLPPKGLSEKIAKRAIKRAKRRKKIEKTVLFFIPFLILASFALLNNLEYFLPASSPELEGKDAIPPFHFQQNNLEKPIISKSSSEQFQIKMTKIDHSLEIRWDGEGEFVVYKCESPEFDRCSVADVVSGNRYLDRDDNSAKIVYYRIEPLKKG